LQQANNQIRRHHSKNGPAPGAINCMIIAESKEKHYTILREYIAKSPKLHLTGKSEPGTDLFQHAVSFKVDVIFWDIKLLDSNIILRLHETGLSPIVICLATKPEQEKKETDMDIFSYLYRPFSFENFLAIIQSVKTYLAAPVYIQHAKSNRFLFVKSEYKIIKVKFEDILFCEGMKDYTQVYLRGKNEPILTLNNLKLFLSKLPANEFIRVHRSFIVSINHIDSISRNEIYIDKKIIPVGDSYKDEFYQLIEANS
jgi:DNA-binding LytR/AlgR family response regulator